MITAHTASPRPLVVAILLTSLISGPLSGQTTNSAPLATTNAPPSAADQARLSTVAEDIASQISMRKDAFTEQCEYDMRKVAEITPVDKQTEPIFGFLAFTNVVTKDGHRAMFMTVDSIISANQADDMTDITAIDLKIGDQFCQIEVTPERLSNIKTKIINGQYVEQADVTLTFRLNDDEMAAISKFIHGEKMLVRIESKQSPVGVINSAGISALRSMFKCYACLGNDEATKTLNLAISELSSASDNQ